MVLLGWFLILQSATDELDAERAKEPGLRTEYRSKLAQAVNLPELRKQKLQVEEYVTQLEKQLPGKAEMDALLSDINQAGIGRGLQFELFRPGQVVVKDYYAELPIAIRVTGRYHDIGAFAADIANLSRIVTLHNLSIGTPNAQRSACHGRDGENLPLSRSKRDRRAEEGGRPGSEKMMRATSALALGVLLLLAGCGSDIDELQQWMDQQRREVQPTVQPISPPKKFDPQPYSVAEAVEPFSTQKLSVALKQDVKQPNSLLAAEMSRRKEPLEAYPLDSMSMVGSVVRAGRPYALLRVDNLLYQVKAGDYLGQNFGKITKITETDIALREIVQDAAGEWIERPSTLQLQERGR